MASLIEKFLTDVANENKKLGSACDELMAAQNKVQKTLPTLLETVIKREECKEMKLLDTIEILQQVLEDRYGVDDAKERVISIRDGLDNLLEKFHGSLDVNIGEYVEELEKQLQTQKGIIRVELLDGDVGEIQAVALNDNSINAKIDTEDLKQRIYRGWNRTTLLFSFDHIYPIMTIDLNPNRLKFLDNKTLYEHMNIKIGTASKDPQDDHKRTIPFEIRIDNIRNAILPYNIGDFLKMSPDIQPAFIRAVVRRKESEKCENDNTNTTERK